MDVVGHDMEGSVKFKGKKKSDNIKKKRAINKERQITEKTRLQKLYILKKDEKISCSMSRQQSFEILETEPENKNNNER